MVSIVIPNYNGERFLKDCLEALRRQTLTRPQLQITLLRNLLRNMYFNLIKEKCGEK